MVSDHRPRELARVEAKHIRSRPGLFLMRTHNLSLATAAACLIASLPSLPRACGDVVTLVPSHDTTLIEIQPDRNNGGQAWVNAGTTQNGTRNRGLFQWDLTGVIPSGATVESVDVTLEVTRVPGCGIANSSFSLYRMLRSWGEGDKVALDNAGGQGAPATLGEATWNERFFGASRWAAPGGLAGVDFLASPSASDYIYDRGRSPYTFASGSELVADVQGWVKDPSSNFGWLLMTDDEGTPFTARHFGSREDPNAPPLLTIEFAVVPEPGWLTLCAIGLAALAGCLGRKLRPLQGG